jgi:hypothetical protein
MRRCRDDGVRSEARSEVGALDLARQSSLNFYVSTLLFNPRFYKSFPCSSYLVVVRRMLVSIVVIKRILIISRPVEIVMRSISARPYRTQ